MIVCYSCSEPAAPGRKRCEKHLAESRAARARYCSTEKGRINRKIVNTKQAAYFRDHRRAEGRFRYVKDVARRKGREWTLTEPEYLTLIAEPCGYCGLKSNVEASIGLDRLDNSKGYIQGNCVSCCVECNIARRDHFTPNEMKIIGAAIRAVKLARLEVPRD